MVDRLNISVLFPKGWVLCHLNLLVGFLNQLLVLGQKEYVENVGDEFAKSQDSWIY